MGNTAAETTAELGASVSRSISRLGVNIVAELTKSTPVDFGWAQNGWVPSIGQPVADLFEGQLPEDEGDPLIAEAFAEQQAGLAELLTYQLYQGNVFITNHVPYIVALNDGHSEQADPGFVEEAINIGIEISDQTTSFDRLQELLRRPGQAERDSGLLPV